MVFLFATQLGICSVNSSCVFITDPIAETLIIFIPVFLFSLITLRLKNETFRSWLKFTYIWVPLTIFLTILTPEYGTNNFIFSIEKGSISLVFSALFVAFSLIIVIVKSIHAKMDIASN